MAQTVKKPHQGSIRDQIKRAASPNVVSALLSEAESYSLIDPRSLRRIKQQAFVRLEELNRIQEKRDKRSEGSDQLTLAATEGTGSSVKKPRKTVKRSALNKKGGDAK